MPKLFIHLGLHKTATSTLQDQLFPATHGLNYFSTLQDATRRFVHLATRQDPIHFDAPVVRRLLSSRFSEAQVNLLSNESLSGPPFAGVMEGGLDHRTPVIQNLSACFPDADLILVVRRQDKLAQSFYRQYIKSGGTRSIERFYGHQENRPPLLATDRFRFSPYIKLLKESFSGRLLVLPFEHFVEDSSAFLGVLGDFLGVEWPELELRRDNATRMGSFGLEASRLGNHLFRNLLNPGGLLPGIPVRRYGKYQMTSPVNWLQDNSPLKGEIKEGTRIDRVAKSILHAVREDNKILAEELDIDLGRYNYL